MNNEHRNSHMIIVKMAFDIFLRLIWVRKILPNWQESHVILYCNIMSFRAILEFSTLFIIEKFKIDYKIYTDHLIPYLTQKINISKLCGCESHLVKVCDAFFSQVTVSLSRATLWRKKINIANSSNFSCYRFVTH